MKFQSFLLILMIIFVLGGCVGSGTTTQVTTSTQSVEQIVKYKGPKARIAVASFKCKAAKCTGQIGAGIADMLTNALFNTGRFIVLERGEEGFEAIQRELSLTQSGVITQNRKFSRLEGADILVVGAITAFEPRAGGIGGGGIIVPGVPFLGAVKVGKEDAYIAADIRLIDVSTGRVIATATVEGKASKWKVGTLGGGVAGDLILGGGLSVYKNTPMEKAIRVMINDAVDKISKLIPEEYYRYPSQEEPTSKSQPTSTPSAGSSSAYGTSAQESQFELIFKEDFEKYGIGQVAPFGPWSIWERQAKIIVGVQSNKQTGKMLDANGKIINKNIKIKNFKLTADIFSKIKEAVICFRISEAKPYTFYELRIGRFGRFDLIKVAGNSQRVIASNQSDERERWRKITIIAKDSNIKVFDGNKIVIDINDNDPYMNKAGNIAIGSTYVSLIDNLFIYKLK